MKTFVAFVAALVVMVSMAWAEVHYEFHCTGSGNMVINNDPVYSGQIDGGDLAPGLWWIEVNDDGWPDASDPQARWAYIWTNYYVYDAGSQIWTATFSECILDLEKTGTGTMHGTCDMTFQIIDQNGNGVLDPEECMDGLSGAVIIIEDGTGAYAHLCGDGTYQGWYMRDCVEGSDTWMNDNIGFDMYLDLYECGMATDASSWGAVKALFR